MSESSYDENLLENNFLQCLCQNYTVIYSKAIQESWIICVPRRGSYLDASLSSDDISAHILIAEESPGCAFQTLAGGRVELKDRVLIVRNEKKIQKSSLLFEETFYSDDLSKYKVWCIDKPLTTTTATTTSNNTDEVVVVKTLADCMNFFFTSIENKIMLKDLDSMIETFERTHSFIEKASPDVQRELVETLYVECLEKILSDPQIHDKAESNAHYLRNIKISMESYILYGLRSLLPAAVSAATASEDAELNKIIKNLHELQLHELNISTDVQAGIARGRLELSKLDSFVTVLGKSSCLKKTVKYLSEGLETLSTDNLLPILIFVVIRTGLPNWIAQLIFMKQFRFSSGDDNPNGEVGFLITSLEAAIEHVRSGSLSNGTQIFFQPLNNKCNTTEEEINFTNSILIVNHLFTAVKEIDLEKLEQILFSKKQKTISKPILCHPLCTCEKCERNFEESKLTEKSSPNVNSKDENGRTALHIASIFGHITVVEYLLIHDANPNEQDNDGLTVLHCAASRGHQDTVLLLLHANADPTALDSQGNTPLHFAADNGHTSCAKAILYFSEQRRIPLDPSAANSVGDTPLHYASKWGFMPLVEILLEYQANTRAANRRGQTPFTIAHSSHIVRRLEAPSPVMETVLQVPLYRASEMKRVSKMDGGRVSGKRDSEKSHKVDKLLAAITQGDIRLACYYLGLGGPQAEPRDSDLPKLCHPLCVCVNCSPNDEPLDEHSKAFVIGINTHNSRGETALHVASANGLTELVQILLDAGAYVNVYTNYERRTPLHIACINEKMKVVKMLLNCPTSNINAKDFIGDSPLHLAVMNGNVEIIEMLLRHGANVHQRNFKNSTPLELIQERVTKDVFSSLVYNNILKILKSQASSEDTNYKEYF